MCPTIAPMYECMYELCIPDHYLERRASRPHSAPCWRGGGVVVGERLRSRGVRWWKLEECNLYQEFCLVRLPANKGSLYSARAASRRCALARGGGDTRHDDAGARSLYSFMFWYSYITMFIVGMFPYFNIWFFWKDNHWTHGLLERLVAQSAPKMYTQQSSTSQYRNEQLFFFCREGIFFLAHSLHNFTIFIFIFHFKTSRNEA